MNSCENVIEHKLLFLKLWVHESPISESLPEIDKYFRLPRPNYRFRIIMFVKS